MRHRFRAIDWSRFTRVDPVLEEKTDKDVVGCRSFGGNNLRRILGSGAPLRLPALHAPGARLHIQGPYRMEGKGENLRVACI